jgi:hypothetical protein
MMSIVDRVESAKVVARGVAGCTAAGCVIALTLFCAQTGVAQDADRRSGISHPSSAPITVDPGDSSSPAAAPAKPSAAVPMAEPQPDSTVVYGPYVPYRAPGAAVPGAAAPTSAAFDPDANIVTEATAGRAERRLLSAPDAKDNVDDGIVTYVPSKPGEIPDGTLVKVRLDEELSTLTTRPGTKFTAQVSEPVMRDGRVIVPVGSVLEGRVTWVRGGRRIGGAAAIHLEPRSVTLPDGMQYFLRARVIDTNSWENTKVDEEGTIMRSENKKRNVGIIALTTGGGAAAGAMIGGPAGALVGAGVGAGVTTVLWLKQDRQAELPRNLGVVFCLTEPMRVTPASAAVAPVKVDAPGGE